MRETTETGELTLRDLDDLVELHFDYLFGYAHRYFRSPELAEELVQETFLAATEGIERFEGRCSPRTWLTGILRHKFMDRLRARKRVDPVSVDFCDEGQLTALFNESEHWRVETGPLLWGTSREKTLQQKQFLGAVEECLKKLPERVR